MLELHYFADVGVHIVVIQVWAFGPFAFKHSSKSMEVVPLAKIFLASLKDIITN
jgi:hypothetical protein